MQKMVHEQLAGEARGPTTSLLHLGQHPTRGARAEGWLCCPGHALAGQGEHRIAPSPRPRGFSSLPHGLGCPVLAGEKLQL